VSGWWSEQYAYFTMTMTPVVGVDVTSKSIADMDISLTPEFGMEATATSTGEFGLVFDPSVNMAGVNFVGVLALNLEPAIGMLGGGRSTASFDLTLTPTIGMTGAEHYTAAFTITLTPTISQLAYVKQLPHPVPWTL